MATVAVVSGGLDSVTLAYSLAAAGHALDLISFDYGQKHRRELLYAEQTAEDLGASWTLIDLVAAGISQVMSGSALTDASVDVPQGHYAAPTMQQTIVPNRNAIMLSIAYARAVSSSATSVAFAVHGGDHPIYPDCRPGFVTAFVEMERQATDSAIELLAPFIQMTKADIVGVGSSLKVPFDRTWSCYVGGETHCGGCGTCVERREAFAIAGVADPTVYGRAVQGVR
ncbi:MAG: 7-cyano-7-deazaguanine synthase QueC [Candidatus Dormibacteria bacterium]